MFLVGHAQGTNAISLDERNSSEYFTTSEVKPTVRMNDINIHAARHFNIFFKAPLNVNWEKVPEGYVAHFTSGGIKRMVAYSNRGTWVHTLSYYDEFKLPHIRHLVKSVYYDFIINQIIQIEDDSELFYVVQIANAGSFKTLMVCDGDIQIIEDIKKLK